MTLLLPIYMAFMSRLSGGGFVPLTGWRGRLPEIGFALPFGLCGFAWGGWIGAVASVIWSFAWVETGHGTAFHMGARPQEARDRKQFLSHVIDPLCRWLNQPLGGTFYCWLFMALKGWLVCLPAGLWSLFGAIAWPVCYYIGNRHIRRIDGNAVAEFGVGASAGLIILGSM